MERALRENFVVPVVSAVRTAKDFLDASQEPQEFKFDISAVNEANGLMKWRRWSCCVSNTDGAMSYSIVV